MNHRDFPIALHFVTLRNFAMDSDLSVTMLEDAYDGCFFCAPEPWRVIAEGEAVRLIAGAGPICPGYAILAPKQHVHSGLDL